MPVSASLTEPGGDRVSSSATTIHVLAVLFLATFIRSALGFGEALIAVPLLALSMPVQVAAPLAVLVSITVAVVVVIQDWRQCPFSQRGLAGAFHFVRHTPGLLLLKTVPESIVKSMLGVFIIAFALYSLAGRKPELHNDRLAPLFGFTAGILGGAYGMNGPPLVVYGVLRRWQPAQFRATLQGYFLIASMVGMAGYAVTGLWTRTVSDYFLLSLPLALIAIFLGHAVHRRLSSSRFLICVNVGLALIGVLLLKRVYNMLSICQWIYQTPLSIAIRESIWVYPILNVLHCVGILLVAGTIVVVDLRLLGFGMRRLAVSSVVGQVLPWTLCGFAFMFVTGSLLAWSEPVRLYRSLFFPWKLLFLAHGGLNALLFHCGVYRGVGAWDSASLTPARARLGRCVSILCWICVIAAGRAVGYETT